MPGVLRRESFAGEHVPEVGAAAGAYYLGLRAIRIGELFNGSVYFIVEAGPAAAGVEFILRPKERSTAPFADVDPRLKVGLVLPAERRLCTLVDNDSLLFRCQFIDLHSCPASRRNYSSSRPFDT